VTSGDGALVSYYDIDLTTSSRVSELPHLEMYPNPTNEVLNIVGLNPGNRIQIYNIQGKLMKEMETYNSHESIRLENIPNGLFLIIISDEDRIIGQFKAVKE
jgi:hypothetical protein